jgi:hypothetical protein
VRSLYHLTDNMCLPRILCSEELRSGTCADTMGVRIGDEIFFSERYVDLDGITAYRFKPAVSVATFAQAAE